MTDISIYIQRKIESQNQRDSKHWSQRNAERQAWHTLIRMQLMPRTPPNHPVKVTICSYRTRLLDYANLVGGAKPIPDVLKALGYIKDDSPQWFTGIYAQFKVPAGEEKTGILISDDAALVPVEMSELKGTT
jgi:hypothetical protein